MLLIPIRSSVERSLVHAGHLCFRFRNLAAPLLLVAVLIVATRGPFLIGRDVNGAAHGVGIAIVLFGLSLRLAVVGSVGIRRSGIRRRIAAPQLHENGPYACCQHPLYLANAALLIGLSLVYDSPWMAFLALPTALLAIGGMILAEEQFLSQRFGPRYTRYAAKVPRFAVRGIPSVLMRSAWDWRRALRKEHGTVFAAGSTLVVLMFSEHVSRSGVLLWHELPPYLGSVWLALAFGYVGARYLKRTGHLTSKPRPLGVGSTGAPSIGSNAIP